MKLMLLNAPAPVLSELADSPWEVVALDDPGRIKVYADQIDRRVQLVSHVTRSKIDLQAIWNLRRQFRSHRPDVVHAFWGQSLANANLACWSLSRPPALVSYRGIQSVPKRWDPANYLTFLNPSIALHACESDACREGLVAGGVPAEKCRTVYNCVANHRLQRTERRGKRWASLQIPRGAFVVGTMATIRPVKEIHLLLEVALQTLDLPNLHWLIMGPVHDERVSKLAADPRLQDRLHMTGFTNLAASLISGANVFVMPSREEALCRALLEAMTQHVCPVVSSAGGMKELVRHEVDGLVFPSGAVDQLEASIRRLYRHRRLTKQLGEAAAERVRQMCSARRMSERLLSLYDEVVGNVVIPSPEKTAKLALRVE